MGKNNDLLITRKEILLLKIKILRERANNIHPWVPLEKARRWQKELERKVIDAKIEVLDLILNGDWKEN